MYQGILEFKGTWRNYQERVLDHMKQYMDDQKIHIVAAPGSGKTTLGIELIRRLDKKALVLTPSITIREQWAERIREAFLCEGAEPEAHISQTIKAPKDITIITYQALHSAMTHYKGLQKEEVEEGAEENNRTEDVDYSGFDLIETMKKEQLGILCLDECHHLRSEWWKALQEFKKQMKDLQTIALTATPPYDDTPAMWTRYMDMCGEIDEEITIPELVKEGSLCPHQDYVYFNYPTKAEEQKIKEFDRKAEAVTNSLMQDAELASYISTHACLRGESDEDALLEDPDYLGALLIYLQSRQMSFPAHLQRLLAVNTLPKMDNKWMEKLLQGFLYEDTDSYLCDKTYRETLIARLKGEGLIDWKKVTLATNEPMEKMLTNSVGKSNSIKEITFHEYNTSKDSLRLLILTDYIKKEYEKAVGNEEKDVDSLGVIPFFEMLRRENTSRKAHLRLGVLCGTIVVIPAEAKPELEKEIAGIGNVQYTKIGNLPEEEYLKVTPIGDGHFLTAAITNLFSKGYMQVLIGTKSLLGEGWDAPCVNSLILASFVGSFMLSNQMRGRSIRIWKENPEKTSNIWHLVCLRPWKEVVKDQSGQISHDFSLLERRMEHFMGLNNQEDIVENGIQRLAIIKPPFNRSNVAQMNRKMLEMSGEREKLRERWKNALAIIDKIEVVETADVKDRFVTMTVFYDALRNALLSGILVIVFLIGLLLGRGRIFMGLGFVIALSMLITKFPKLFMLGSPFRRLEAIGKGIRKALLEINLLENDNNKVVTQNSGPENHLIYLSGGSGREKALFAQCVFEFFGEVDNQRYLLVKKKSRSGSDGFYCVPDSFSKKREDAEVFAHCMKPYIGEYEVIYTRNEQGRKILLEGRMKAFANRQERCLRGARAESKI